MITELINAFKEADALLNDAQDSQWERPPYPVNDGGGKSATVPDMTSSIALDTKRLRLRAAVLKNERLIREAVVAVRQANADLQKALREWHEV